MILIQLLDERLPGLTSGNFTTRVMGSLPAAAGTASLSFSMSTQAHRLLVITAASAVASGGLFAQTRAPSAEEQLRKQIAELQTETGLARPAELIDPLRALALLYEEGEDYALATATLEEARYVARVHNGLTSADEALLMRQQIRSEKALGLYDRAWNLEQDMLAIARQHHDDVRMLPIFRELADERLGLIEQVRDSERPPMVYAGCYNGEPLPPYDYPRRSQAPAPAGDGGGFTTPSCYGGINQNLVDKLSREILVYYADAIETILKTGDYASEELRQLELDALRISGGRLRVALLGKPGGPLDRCSGGTLEGYLALEILDSCLEPVLRGPGVVIANVGNPPALIRLMQYEFRSAAPPTARANAIARLADWYVRFPPAERRRFMVPQVTYALYERAYRELEQSGDSEASTAMFAPDLPVTLPTYEPNPFEPAESQSARYIDVSFVITRYGTSEQIKILDTSTSATRAEKRDLTGLIENTSFRPRIVNGKIADEAPVSLRYYLR